MFGPLVSECVRDGTHSKLLYILADIRGCASSIEGPRGDWFSVKVIALPCFWVIQAYLATWEYEFGEVLLTLILCGSGKTRRDKLFLSFRHIIMQPPDQLNTMWIQLQVIQCLEFY